MDNNGPHFGLQLKMATDYFANTFLREPEKFPQKCVCNSLKGEGSFSGLPNQDKLMTLCAVVVINNKFYHFFLPLKIFSKDEHYFVTAIFFLEKIVA